jgi:hypothetical protein
MCTYFIKRKQNTDYKHRPKLRRVTQAAKAATIEDNEDQLKQEATTTTRKPNLEDPRTQTPNRLAHGANDQGGRQGATRTTKVEEQQPKVEMTKATKPATSMQAQHRGLHDHVPKEKMTYRCRHSPSRSPDLSFHSHDLPGHSRSDTTVPPTRKTTLRKCRYCRHRQKAAEQGFRPSLKESRHAYHQRRAS